jgi:hypothetical protein
LVDCPIDQQKRKATILPFEGQNLDVNQLQLQGSIMEKRASAAAAASFKADRRGFSKHETEKAVLGQPGRIAGGVAGACRAERLLIDLL